MDTKGIPNCQKLWQKELVAESCFWCKSDFKDHSWLEIWWNKSIGVWKTSWGTIWNVLLEKVQVFCC